MPKGVDELRRRLGEKRFEEIKRLVDKSKAERKSPDEIKAAVRAIFIQDMERDLIIIPAL